MTEGERERVDPFVLPSATSLRFALFAVIGTLAAWYGGRVVRWYVWPEDEIDLRATLVSGLLGVSGLVVLTLALYATHACRIRWRDRLMTPAETTDNLLETRLAGLMEGLGSKPNILVRPGFTGQDAQAFGFPWKPYLRLDGGLRVVLRKAPAVFDAVVLHEIAHFVNRDLLYGYGARALYQGLVIFAAVTAAWQATVFLSGTLEDWRGHLSSWLDVWLMAQLNGLRLAKATGNFGFVLLLAAIEYARLLRVRECYADWGAVQRGARDVLTAVLKRSTTGLSLKGLAFHPSNRSSLGVISDPFRLFEPGALDGFLAGATLGLIGAGVWHISDNVGLLSNIHTSKVRFIIYIISLTYTLPVVAVMAMTMLRASVVIATDRAVGKSLVYAVSWSAASGLGLWCGLIAWPGSIIDLRLDSIFEALYHIPLFIAFATIPFSAGFLCTWTLFRTLVRRWRRLERPNLCLGVIMLAACYAVLQGFQCVIIYIVSGSHDPDIEFIARIYGFYQPMFAVVASLIWSGVVLFVCWLWIVIATRHGRPRDYILMGLPPWLLTRRTGT